MTDEAKRVMAMTKLVSNVRIVLFLVRVVLTQITPRLKAVERSVSRSTHGRLLTPSRTGRL